MHGGRQSAIQNSRNGLSVMAEERANIIAETKRACEDQMGKLQLDYNDKVIQIDALNRKLEGQKEEMSKKSKSDSKKDERINELVDQYEGLRSQYDAKATECEGKKEELLQALSEIKKSKKDIEALKKEALSKDKEVSESNLKVAMLNAELKAIAMKEAAAENYKEEKILMQRELESNKKQVDMLSAQCMKSGDEVSALRRTLVDVESLLHQSSQQIAAMNARMEILSEDNQRLRSYCEQMEQQVRKSNNGEFRRFVDVKAQKVELEKEIDNVKRENQRLQRVARNKSGLLGANVLTKSINMNSHSTIPRARQRDSPAMNYSFEGNEQGSSLNNYIEL